MTESRSLKTGDGKTAQVRLFQGDQWGNREAVAYIDGTGDRGHFGAELAEPGRLPGILPGL